MLGQVWGCRLATYKSYGAVGAGFVAVCWQVLWGTLERVWGCMLATYMPHGAY